MFKVIKSLFILLAAFVVTIFIWFEYQISVPAANNQEIIGFAISQGFGVHQISQDLYNKGLIRSQFYFEVYVWSKKAEGDFIAGVFDLSPSMSIKQITRLLTQADNAEKVITIIEGWSNKEIADYLAKQGLFTREEFLAAVGGNLSDYLQSYEFLSDKPVNVDLEGYLFPDTYRVFRNAAPAEVVKKILDNFDLKLSPELRQKITGQNKTIFEIITLASIIEKEVSRPDDMKMVADIFYKRLAQNMALQSDATVNYVTGKGRVQPSIEDTRADSPYNTYLYAGLPPGPIANPGINAIMAAIEPTENPYYYFLTTKEGEVIYARTYDEHLQNKARYLN